MKYMNNNNCQQSQSLLLNSGYDKVLDNMPVAMAYVPWQTFGKVYDLDKALCCGTIFPCLNKPFSGRSFSR